MQELQPLSRVTLGPWMARTEVPLGQSLSPSAFIDSVSPDCWHHMRTVSGESYIL